MKRILTATIILLYFNSSSAQNSSIGKWKFTSANQVGLLQGESHTAVSLQSINGFRRNHFFAGLGTGLDYYQYRTVPLFAEARWYFGSSANPFYVYADGGTNFVWQQKLSVNGLKETFHPGFYGGAGVGYKAGLKTGWVSL